MTGRENGVRGTSYRPSPPAGANGPPPPRDSGPIRDDELDRRGCPECGAVVECTEVDGGDIRSYQFQKGVEHAQTCRNWKSG